MQEFVAGKEARVDLSLYNNSSYWPGASRLRRFAWYFVNVIFFINPLNPINGLKVFLLKLFGARVGRKVVIKPGVNIKHPWFLTLGDHVWLGEKVWIDNLAPVTIRDNVTVSQGALLLTGSHNYNSRKFDLMVQNILLEEGVWIGAKAIVCPGVRCCSHSVLAAGSVATRQLEAFWIYQGNPALHKRERIIY